MLSSLSATSTWVFPSFLPYSAKEFDYVVVFITYYNSFKKFKNGFFRVVVNPTGRSYFYDDHNKLKLPFYFLLNRRTLCLIRIKGSSDS